MQHITRAFGSCCMSGSRLRQRMGERYLRALTTNEDVSCEERDGKICLSGISGRCFWASSGSTDVAFLLRSRNGSLEYDGRPGFVALQRVYMIVVLMGVSGSGKTTIGTLLAQKEWGCCSPMRMTYHPKANKAEDGGGTSARRYGPECHGWRRSIGVLRGWHDHGSQRA